MKILSNFIIMLFVLTILGFNVSYASDKEQNQNQYNTKKNHEGPKKKETNNGQNNGSSSSSSSSSHQNQGTQHTYTDTFGQTKPDHNKNAIELARKRFATYASEKGKEQSTNNDKNANRQQSPPKKKEESSSGHHNKVVDPYHYPASVNVSGDLKPDHKEATRRIMQHRFGKKQRK